jgi:hypothetical protein
VIEPTRVMLQSSAGIGLILLGDLGQSVGQTGIISHCLYRRIVAAAYGRRVKAGNLGRLRDARTQLVAGQDS